MSAIASKRGSFSTYLWSTSSHYEWVYVLAYTVQFLHYVFASQNTYWTRCIHIWAPLHGWGLIIAGLIWLNMQDVNAATSRTSTKRTHRGWYQQMAWFSMPMSAECWADPNALIQSLNLCARNLCKVAAGASAQPDTNGSNLRNSDQLL